MIRTCAVAMICLTAGPGSADAVVDDIFLQVLASEEDMADAFAVVLLTAEMPESVAAILTNRVAAHWVEDDAPGPFSDDSPDRTRAGRMVCLYHGLEPAARARA